MLANAAYNADHLRATVHARAGHTVIPSGTGKRAFGGPLYRERQLVGGCISKLKQFRGIATRSEKIARNRLIVLACPATILRLR